MSNQEIIRRRHYCQIVKETKIHRLIRDRAIFMSHNVFLNKNSEPSRVIFLYMS